MTFGESLRLCREKAGMGIKTVAHGVGGIHRNTIHNWEEDFTEPTVSQANALARVLGCSFNGRVLVPVQSGVVVVGEFLG